MQTQNDTKEALCPNNKDSRLLLEKIHKNKKYGRIIDEEKNHKNLTSHKTIIFLIILAINLSNVIIYGINIFNNQK